MFENYQPPAELKPSDPRFGVGPSLIPLNYVQKMLEEGPHYLGTSHRKPGFKNVAKEIQEGLKTYFQLPDGHEVVFGNGGASLLFDMIGLGIVEKKSHHFVCGEFSKKWHDFHKLVPWIEVENTSVEFGKGVTPAAVEADTLCMTLNETSTGVIFDKLPPKSSDYLITVDATSGAGQVACDVGQTDIFFFSPQKVFASEGGTFIAIMSPAAIDRALKISEDKSRYQPGMLSWKAAIENSRKNQTFNTPSFSSFYFLNEQIKTMNKVSYKGVVEDGLRKSKLLYGWATEKDYLRPFIQEEKYRSTVVATIDVDDKIPAEELTKRLRELQYVYDIDAYRKLGRNQLRISMFHNVKYDDLEKLTKLVSHAIESI